MAGKRGGFPLPVIAVVVVLILSRVAAAMDEGIAEDFPLFAAIAAFILFRVITARNEAKRRGPIPTPMPEPASQKTPNDLGFEITPLRGAPKDVQAEAQPSDEELDVLRRESYERHLAEKQAREEKMEQERLGREHQKRETPTEQAETWQFSPNVLRNAVILSEILAPPKALRRKK